MADNIKAVQQDYRHLATTYEKRWRTFLSASRNWGLARLPDTPPETILDCGCGTGVMLKMLGTRYPDALLNGVDISPDMLKTAKQNVPQANLMTGDLAHITGQYDMALSLNVLHHLFDADTHLQTLRNIITPNGTVYLCDFALDSLLMRSAEIYWRNFHAAHRRAYSARALQRLITKNGLCIKAQAVLKPNHFWRLQIYKLSRTNSL